MWLKYCSYDFIDYEPLPLYNNPGLENKENYVKNVIKLLQSQKVMPIFYVSIIEDTQVPYEALVVLQHELEYDKKIIEDKLHNIKESLHSHMEKMKSFTS